MSAGQPPEKGDCVSASVNDTTVQSMIKSGFTVIEIIGTLAQEKSALLNRIAALEAIAPKKTILPNGQTMIWHCPDELIPEVTK